ERRYDVAVGSRIACRVPARSRSFLPVCLGRSVSCSSVPRETRSPARRHRIGSSGNPPRRVFRRKFTTASDMSVTQQAESSDVVSISGLHKRYGQLDALSSVDLVVRRGEIFGLLGPNGAGKTTLIKTLVGSTRPTAGSARVLGLDPRAQSRALRPQIGYMPQAPALYEDLSPRHNLRFFGRAHG